MVPAINKTQINNTNIQTKTRLLIVVDSLFLSGFIKPINSGLLIRQCVGWY
nr:hypothetical protein CJLB15_00032 [Campylobacter phage CJLB-15]